jgi:hypothetical protein
MGGISALVLNIVLPEGYSRTAEAEGVADTDTQISGDGPAVDED